MGWIVLLAIALAAGALLWVSGFPHRLWTVPATALMLGAAGYAWQGSPGLAGAPVAAAQQKGEVDANLVALRDQLFGRFNLEFAYFTAADAMTRAGDPQAAAGVMVGAVRKLPDDAAMWTGLGLKLAENDAMQISPAAKFAFDRALQLAPQHPGPPFFYGLSLIRAGKFEEAKPWWQKAVQLADEKASYRKDLVIRLFLLERFLEAKAAQERAPAATR